MPSKAPFTADHAGVTGGPPFEVAIYRRDAMKISHHLKPAATIRICRNCSNAGTRALRCPASPARLQLENAVLGLGRLSFRAGVNIGNAASRQYNNTRGQPAGPAGLIHELSSGRVEAGETHRNRTILWLFRRELQRTGIFPDDFKTLDRAVHFVRGQQVMLAVDHKMRNPFGGLVFIAGNLA